MDEGEREAGLLAQAVAGEQAALEELLLTYYDRLLRFIAPKLPASLRGAIGAEDILQQTFIEVFQRIRSFEPRGTRAFYRWVAMIAEHRLRDVVRAQRTTKRGGDRVQVERAASAALDTPDDLIDLLAGDQRTPSQSAARHEAVAAVQVGLAALKEEHRQAIQLRYVQGLSVADAAEAMDRKPRAVCELCYRGLEELRAVLGRSSQYFSRR